MVLLPSFAQFTTGTVTLTASPLMTVKIDTDASTATLTLVGPSNTWLGIGFGATSMANINDYFIWSSSVNRDYSPDPNDGYNTPMPDTNESWTIDSDIVVSTTRTIIAKRTLTSLGDYTFANTNTSIPIVYARGTTSQSFAKHAIKGGITLTRTALGVEDFSLNTAAIYPNPSNGNFKIEAKSPLTKLSVYTQSGTFVKTIVFEGNSNTEDVNLKNLATGVYFIELQSDSDKAWKKIIIQ